MVMASGVGGRSAFVLMPVNLFGFVIAENAVLWCSGSPRAAAYLPAVPAHVL